MESDAGTSMLTYFLPIFVMLYLNPGNGTSHVWGSSFNMNWYIQMVVSKVTLDPIKLNSTLNIISSKFYTTLPSHFQLQSKKLVNTLEICSGFSDTKKKKQI